MTGRRNRSVASNRKGLSVDTETGPEALGRSREREIPRIAVDAFGRAHRAQKKILEHEELLEALVERARRLEKRLADTATEPPE